MGYAEAATATRVAFETQRANGPKPEAFAAFKQAVWAAVESGEPVPTGISRAAWKTDREADRLVARGRARVKARHDLDTEVPRLRREAAEARKLANATPKPGDRALTSITTVNELMQVVAEVQQNIVPKEHVDAAFLSHAANATEAEARRVLRETSDPALSREAGELIQQAEDLRGRIAARADSLSLPGRIEFMRRRCDELAAGGELDVTSPASDRETQHRKAREKLARMQAELDDLPRHQAEQARNEAALANLQGKIAELEAKKFDPLEMSWV